MGLNCNLSKETITRICMLWQAGFATMAIAQETGVSRRSVERWLKAFRESPTGEIPMHKKPAGKSMKVPVDTLSLIKACLEVEPELTARDLKKAYPQLLGNVSLRTVCRYRKISMEMNVPAWRRITTPLLTDRYTNLRFAFAKKYKTMPLEVVRKILWTDEATFSVTGITSGVGGPSNSDASDPLGVKNVRQLGTVTVWGSFSYYGLGKLVFLEDGVVLNGLRYLEILYDNLADSFDACKAEMFQQDRAPFHTNRCVLEWLDDCRIDYFRDWPPNSPDLNLMEDIWTIMRRELHKRDTRTLPKLKESLTAVWENLSGNLLRRLVDSYPERLQEVVSRKGSTIIRQILNIDGSESSGSIAFNVGTTAGTLPTRTSSTETSPGPSSRGSSEREILYDDDLDLKVEIKEEVVDDIPDFVDVMSHQSQQVEMVLDPKEDPVNVFEATKRSSSASTSTPVEKVGLPKTKVEDPDEFHLFGMNVASQLRALPLRDALQAQLEIQTILAQKRSQRLT